MSEKLFNLAQLAEITQSSLIGNPEHLIRNVADLDNALEEDASFLSNLRYAQSMKTSKAGVIFIAHKTPLNSNQNYLLSDNPSKAFQQLVDLLFPQRGSPSGFYGVHSSAIVHPSAVINETVTIGPQAVIDEGVTIEADTFIGAGSYIGPNVKIGQNCLVHPRVVIRENCIIGNRVILQPGCIIGSCGFGYLTDKQGNHVKLNQVGNVKIEDDVEIGANATIDRARFKSTVIGQGSKVDNLVQIGHGACVGKHNIIVAQCGIAGSTTTGKYVILAGQAAIAGHLRIADGVTLAAKSGVTKSLPSGKYAGFPATSIEAYNRNQVYLKNIEKFVKKLNEIAKKLNIPN
ncbi:MAG: UDP-3-O-(3-hydroxymyristoyl)glucosamine N-acyltransferase [Candidatus Protochlamydia sp.]|nr:UDP-3-O-(3-hydroxymyristoyl)glucosamine N-acyltransferase [Candidatus Protochlamydia sp.]